MVPARAGGLTFSDREGDRGVHKGVREHERLQVRTDEHGWPSHGWVWGSNRNVAYAYEGRKCERAVVGCGDQFGVRVRVRDTGMTHLSSAARRSS